MNASARKIVPRQLPLRALCLAITIALALPIAAWAQDTSSAPSTATATTSDSEPAEEPANDALFSLDDSDDPEKLKDLTQISSSVEIGLFHVSDDSFRFGRYTGLTDQGLGAVLNLDLHYRGAFDSDSAQYWSFKGNDLGLDSRDASLEFGTQGKYRVRIDYDQIPIFRSDSARTIFDGAGSTHLTLPSNWVGSGTTAAMTQLLPSLRPVELKTERRQTTLGISGVLSPNWSYSTSYKNENKDGNKSIGAVFGNSGGNPRAAIVPEPVDYNTQQFDAALRYANKALQMEAAYYLSIFSDQNTALTWANPYTTITGWATGTGFPVGVGQLSLPPDNKFHQVSLNIGYNISDLTRFSASAARGRMTQNDAFLPYTAIASLAASITQPLPRTSLDGRIDTTVVNLRIASRPWTDFSWNASYRYDDRDNETPRDVYVYIAGDSQLQNTGVTSSQRRYNEPYSYKEEQYKVDASYRVFGNTEFSAAVQRSDIDRSYLERERADEDTYSLGINTQAGDRFNGHLRFTWANRDGSTYVGNEPFLSGYSPGYTSTIAAGWENHPGLRRFFEANRDRRQLNATVEFMATEAWTLSAAIDNSKDEYNESELGLIDAKSDSYTFDTVYAPSPMWSASAFYTREKLESHQDGHSFSGGAVQIPQAADPNREWFVFHRDRITSYGAGFKHSLSSGRLDFGIDYLSSKTHSTLDFLVGSALLTKPLPPDATQLKSFSVYANYKLSNNLSFRLGYWYERYHSSDWAVDGIMPNTLANVILLGETSPDYSVQFESLSLTYRF